MDVMNDRINAAIDLLTMMVVESIAKEDDCDASDVLPSFLRSHTGEANLFTHLCEPFACFRHQYDGFFSKMSVNKYTLNGNVNKY